MKARKRPVEVEVVRIGQDVTVNQALKFCEGKAYINPYDQNMYIETLEGNMKVGVGDYIIKGVNGEFYPIKPDIFRKTYEIID